MADGKRLTYTDVLLREICAHLECCATDPRRSFAEQTAMYAAVREIGRNRGKFVREAMRQMAWQEAMTKHTQEASHVGR